MGSEKAKERIIVGRSVKEKGKKYRRRNSTFTTSFLLYSLKR